MRQDSKFTEIRQIRHWTIEILYGIENWIFKSIKKLKIYVKDKFIKYNGSTEMDNDVIYSIHNLLNESSLNNGLLIEVLLINVLLNHFSIPFCIKKWYINIKIIIFIIKC